MLRLLSLLNRRKGNTAVDYALIIAAITIVLVLIADPLDNIIDDYFDTTATQLVEGEVNSNTAPTITNLSSGSTAVHLLYGPVSFTIGDAQSDFDELTLFGTSSDLDLVKDDAIVFGGTGPIRNVSVTPVATSSGGDVDITVFVNDGNKIVSDSFTLTIHAPDPQFVATTDAGNILISADGISWTDQGNVVGAILRKVHYDGDYFLTAGHASTMHYSFGTTGWTASGTIPNNEIKHGLADNGTLYVMVGNAGRIWTSSTPDSWTERTSGTANGLKAVAYDGSGQFIAVGDVGTILSSSDGISWSSETSGTINNLNDVYHDGSTYIVVGDTGTILTSTNGSTWISRTSGVTTLLQGIAYDGSSTYVVCGWGGGKILTSSNLVAWTDRGNQGNQLNQVVFAAGVFTTVGVSGSVYTSPDGITWTSRTSGVADNLKDVIWAE